MRRRDFIKGIAGSTVILPLAARAQQPDRVRRIGVLMAPPENDPQSRARVTALEQGLDKIGWAVGRNVQIDYRFGISDDARAQVATAELLRLATDVMVANGPPAVRAVQQASSTMPIVFVAVSEPIAYGFIANLAHPSGNVTGFANLEPSLGAKWVELLKEMAPDVTKAAFLFNPAASSAASLFFRAAQEFSSKSSVELVMAPIQGLAEMDEVITGLARQANCGLIFPPDTFTSEHYEPIVELVARHRLPAIYAFRYFASAGGLVSYGPDVVDQFRRAATYVDRILRGEKPGDLPVQQPTKFEFIINLKTARTLGLAIPPNMLALADEVIE